MTLREPTLIAQALATLDELSDGRAEGVLSSGNFGLLAQYGIDWSRTRPLSRVKEALHVVRTLLDEGSISYDGEFFTYDGLSTFARPVEERVPLKLGAMRGPKSFEAEGELSDGCHHALSYTREAYDYAVRHIRTGAERAGRDWQSLDIGAWVASRPDLTPPPPRTRHAARSASTPPPCPRNSCAATAWTLASSNRSSTPSPPATWPGGIEMTTPDIAERLSIAGTPEECAEKIRREIAPSGVNHMICALTDRTLVKAFTGRDLAEVADVNTQLRLIHDRIMPAFA